MAKFSDLFRARSADAVAEVAAAAALKVAEDADAAAVAAGAASEAALAKAITRVGSAYESADDGSIKVYVADGRGGYTVTVPKGPDTDVPEDESNPAPDPTPAPTPGTGTDATTAQ